MRCDTLQKRLMVLAAISAGFFIVTCTSFAYERPLRYLTLDEDAEVIELFEGLSQGVLEVRVVPRDAFDAGVFLTNTSENDLTIAVPKTVAAVHVLGQFDFDSFSPDSDSNSSQGGSQRTGGQLGSSGSNDLFSSSGNNSNQFGPGSSFFSIPAEKTVQITLNSVCLDHGKPDPARRMNYVLVPVEREVESLVLRHVLATFDPEKTDRQAVQAAAWFLQGSLNWKELEGKKKTRIGRIPKPYFTKSQIERARQLVEEAEKAVSSKQENVATVEKKL